MRGLTSRGPPSLREWHQGPPAMHRQGRTRVSGWARSDGTERVVRSDPSGWTTPRAGLTAVSGRDHCAALSFFSCAALALGLAACFAFPMIRAHPREKKTRCANEFFQPRKRGRPEKKCAEIIALRRFCVIIHFQTGRVSKCTCLATRDHACTLRRVCRAALAR